MECIKAKGFKNDIVARMTVSVSQGGDIYEEVMHILCVPLFGFFTAHTSSTRASGTSTGQLDCNWDTPDNERIEEWCQWRDTSYNPGITRLADEFERELENGRILPIAPFTGVLYS